MGTFKQIFLKRKYILLFIVFNFFVVWTFRNAFSMGFFADDYEFLKISNISNLKQIFNFFNPIRQTFYRPVPTELFYFILNQIDSVFLGHIIVFVIFSIGLYFLYKTITSLAQNELWALLSVFFYGLHFTHVFQLYWFAAFQEIALTTGLIISFYAFIKGKNLTSLIFFIIALLSKETALVYPFFIVLYCLHHKKIGENRFFIIASGIVSMVMFIILKNGIASVSSIDIYRPQFSIGLPLNNLIWYSLWSLGLPNVLPLYFPTLTSLPNKEIYELFRIPEFKIYIFGLITFSILMLGGLVVMMYEKKSSLAKIAKSGLFLIGGFILFTAPTLFIFHKWIVRLTIPVIFISVAYAYITAFFFNKKGWFRLYVGVLLILFLIWNSSAVLFHESASLHMQENKIYYRLSSYIKNNYKSIIKSGGLCFIDAENDPKGLNGSQRLRNSLHGTDFITHFFPNEKVKVYYQFESKTCPNVHKVASYDILWK